MSDKTTTTFEKMGNTVAVAHTADPSPNLKYRPRGHSKGGSGEPATANHRTGHQERLGAKYAPQMTISQPNSPESGDVQRNVRIVPSAVGNRDFYMKRQYGQNTQ